MEQSQDKIVYTYTVVPGGIPKILTVGLVPEVKMMENEFLSMLTTLWITIWCDASKRFGVITHKHNNYSGTV